MTTDDPQEPSPQVQRLLSLQEVDETDADFARRLGLSPQTVSNYKSGSHGLSLVSARSVHDEVGVSLNWLVAGHGSRWMSDDESAQPFEEGGRYVFDRLVHAVVRIADSVEQAGVLDEDEGTIVRQMLNEYLDVTGNS